MQKHTFFFKFLYVGHEYVQRMLTLGRDHRTISRRSTDRRDVVDNAELAMKSLTKGLRYYFRVAVENSIG